MLSNGEIISLSASARTKLTEVIEGMAKQSLRCLAFACKTQLGPLTDYDGDQHPSHKLLLDPSNYEPLESELIWLGVAGLQDPPRPEVASAIAECHAAGVHVRLLLISVCCCALHEQHILEAVQILLYGHCSLQCLSV